MPQRRIVYWDSCIFIAWLKNERRPVGEIDGIAECVEQIETGEVKLITSVITRTEVYETDLSPEVREQYSRFLGRRNVNLIDQDLRISELAREIREYYTRQGRQDGLGGLTTPDAVHLATAIHYRADSFYTFDDGQKGGRSLLSLSGNVAGHPLHICKPFANQLRL